MFESTEPRIVVEVTQKWWLLTPDMKAGRHANGRREGISMRRTQRDGEEQCGRKNKSTVSQNVKTKHVILRVNFKTDQIYIHMLY